MVMPLKAAPPPQEAEPATRRPGAPDFRTAPRLWAALHARFEPRSAGPGPGRPRAARRQPYPPDFRTLPADAWVALHALFGHPSLTERRRWLRPASARVRMAREEVVPALPAASDGQIDEAKAEPPAAWEEPEEDLKAAAPASPAGRAEAVADASASAPQQAAAPASPAARAEAVADAGAPQQAEDGPSRPTAVWAERVADAGIPPKAVKPFVEAPAQVGGLLPSSAPGRGRGELGQSRASRSAGSSIGAFAFAAPESPPQPLRLSPPPRTGKVDDSYIRDLKGAIAAKEAKLRALAAQLQELSSMPP